MRIRSVMHARPVGHDFGFDLLHQHVRYVGYATNTGQQGSLLFAVHNSQHEYWEIRPQPAQRCACNKQPAIGKMLLRRSNPRRCHISANRYKTKHRRNQCADDQHQEYLAYRIRPDNQQPDDTPGV